MIPSGAKGPRWASVNSTGTCAAADSQPKTDTHGGDSGGQAHRLAVFLGRGRQGSPPSACRPRGAAPAGGGSFAD